MRSSTVTVSKDSKKDSWAPRSADRNRHPLRSGQGCAPSQSTTSPSPSRRRAIHPIEATRPNSVIASPPLRPRWASTMPSSLSLDMTFAVCAYDTESSAAIWRVPGRSSLSSTARRMTTRSPTSVNRVSCTLRSYLNLHLKYQLCERRHMCVRFGESVCRGVWRNQFSRIGSLRTATVCAFR